MDRVRLLLIVVGGIGAFACGTWGYVFWLVIRDGQYIVRESIGWLLNAEFGFAIALTIISLMAILVAFHGD